MLLGAGMREPVRDIDVFKDRECVCCVSLFRKSCIGAAGDYVHSIRRISKLRLEEDRHSGTMVNSVKGDTKSCIVSSRLCSVLSTCCQTILLEESRYTRRTPAEPSDKREPVVQLLKR